MSDVFNALAHPVRREILKLLRDGPLSAGQLAEQFNLSKPTLSGHFTVLKNAGLITAERRGTTRKAGLAASSGGYLAGWIGAMTVMFVAHCTVILKARGWPVDILGTVSIITALLFIAIGNVLGKTRPNAFVGVRTPWTRRSDYSWDKSNRAAGRMMVVSGLATLAVLAVAGPKAANIVLIGGIAVMTVVSVILSYIYWRRDPARRSGTGDA